MILNAEKLLQNKEKAMRKITGEKNAGDLYGVLKAAKDDDIRRLTVERIHELRPGSMYDLYLTWGNDAVIRETILRVTDDEQTLFRIAMHPGTCPEAVDRLKWQEHLIAVVRQFGNPDTREYALRALRRIEDRTALRQLAEDPFRPDSVRRECVRLLAESQEDICRMAAEGEGCLPALELLDQEHLIRLARDKTVRPEIRTEAAGRVDDEEELFGIGETARSQGNGEVLKAAAGRLSDPKRRCALGVHDFVPAGKQYGGQNGDWRYIYQDMRCTVCGETVKKTVNDYRF